MQSIKGLHLQTVLSNNTTDDSSRRKNSTYSAALQ